MIITPLSVQAGLSSSLLVKEGKAALLLDAGEGTLGLFTKASSPEHLKGVLIGHMHGDHVNGLPTVINGMKYRKSKEPLVVAGPRGIKEYLEVLVRCHAITSSVPLKVYELEEGSFNVGVFEVTVLPLEHRVPTIGFRIEEASTITLDASKLRAMGLSPGPKYGQLKRGVSVEHEGALIRSQDVLLEQKGRVVAYCCDTEPCDAVLRLAHNADLLIHDSTYTHDRASVACLHHHSTAQEAAIAARDAQAAALLLTHFSPRYREGHETLLNEARAFFPESQIAIPMEPHKIGRRYVSKYKGPVV